MLSTVLFCVERCRVQLKGAKQRQKNTQKIQYFLLLSAVCHSCLVSPFAVISIQSTCDATAGKPPREQLSAGQVNLKSCWEELILLFISLEIKRRCVQKWMITFQPHSSPSCSHCQKKEQEPGFFSLFSCPFVAFVWRAQLCDEKVYERTAFTPDKCVRSVAERERGFVTAENRYFISNARKILPTPFFCVRCCTWSN